MPDTIDTITVPDYIRKVLSDIDQARAPIDEAKVSSAIKAVRNKSTDIPDAENTGAWAELLAFSLVGPSTDNPWDTYFGPNGWMDDGKGGRNYIPSLDGFDGTFIDHWRRRADAVKHPVLKARYCDLVWDLSHLATGTRSDVDFARRAVDAYLESLDAEWLPDDHHRFAAAIRALTLAAKVKDGTRVEAARAALLTLHGEAMDSIRSSGKGMWWRAIEPLLGSKGYGLTEDEKRSLVADLETVFKLYSDQSNPKVYNPHQARDAAQMLLTHFSREKNAPESKRVRYELAQAMERFAGLGDSMLASQLLQDAFDLYRQGGFIADAKRARIAMQDKIRETRKTLKPFGFTQQVKKEDLERWLEENCGGDVALALDAIAERHLLKKAKLQTIVEQGARKAPLFSLLSKVVLADDHVAGKVGAVGEDELGPLLMQASRLLQHDGFWLHYSLAWLLEHGGLTGDSLIAHINRNGLFDEDTDLLAEGIGAWLDGDHIKALHVLIPQIERGARELMGWLGEPVTKSNKTTPGIGQSIGMGDVSSSEAFRDELGPDLPLHLSALYSDPRGWNLRNRFAHGLLHDDEIHEGVTNWLIHTLLVLSAVRLPSDDAPDAEPSSGGQMPSSGE
jgi:lysyl-tRNA synthetase class 1